MKNSNNLCLLLRLYKK